MRGNTPLKPLGIRVIRGDMKGNRERLVLLANPGVSVYYQHARNNFGAIFVPNVMILYDTK